VHGFWVDVALVPIIILHEMEVAMTYGNLEIIVEGMTQEQLDELLQFITEKVESMNLVLAGRAFLTSDEEYEDAQESESIT